MVEDLKKKLQEVVKSAEKALTPEEVKIQRMRRVQEAAKKAGKEMEKQKG